MSRIVTGDEMKALDRRASEEFAIPSLLLMENAGRSTADLVCSRFQKESVQGRAVLILCGKGNNGGDGFVIARHLANRGWPVRVILFGAPSLLTRDAAVNFEIIRKMDVPITDMSSRFDADDLKRELDGCTLVIDALFGIGLRSDLKAPYPDVIKAVNRSAKTVVAVDIPSGLDADTGKIHGSAIRASMTAAMGLAKKGLYEGEGPQFAGEIVVMDIGIPKQILGPGEAAPGD